MARSSSRRECTTRPPEGPTRGRARSSVAGPPVSLRARRGGGAGVAHRRDGPAARPRRDRPAAARRASGRPSGRQPSSISRPSARPEVGALAPVERLLREPEVAPAPPSDLDQDQADRRRRDRRRPGRPPSDRSGRCARRSSSPPRSAGRRRAPPRHPRRAGLPWRVRPPRSRPTALVPSGRRRRHRAHHWGASAGTRLTGVPSPRPLTRGPPGIDPGTEVRGRAGRWCASTGTDAIDTGVGGRWHTPRLGVSAMGTIEDRHRLDGRLGSRSPRTASRLSPHPSCPGRPVLPSSCPCVTFRQ